jgi:TRAP-type C4-dicarboxylate transport system substrate-binding protein
MRRSLLRSFVVAAAAAVGLAAATASQPASAKTTWDYYLFTGITHPVSKALIEFADEVRKRTNGELDIVVRPAGELPFRATESLKIAGQGQVQMASAYAGFLSGTVPLASITTTPFLVRTYDELDQVMPIVAKYTEPKFEAMGAKILFWWSWPEQNLYGTGDPIVNLADFKGRKFRVTDPKQAAMIERFGASTVSLTTAEVPVAMERGLMEGVFTAAFNAVGAKWYEFLEWGWMANVHIGGPNYEFVNLKAYNALPADVRKTLDEVAAEFTPKMNARFSKMESEARETLMKDHGITLTDAPASAIKDAVAIMTPYWEEWAKEHKAEAAMKEIRAKLGR